MGRIKTKNVKRAGEEFLSKFGSEFTTDFAHNKTVLGKTAEIRSKKLRNLVAGHIVKLVKKEN